MLHTQLADYSARVLRAVKVNSDPEIDSCPALLSRNYRYFQRFKTVRRISQILRMRECAGPQVLCVASMNASFVDIAGQWTLTIFPLFSISTDDEVYQ